MALDQNLWTSTTGRPSHVPAGSPPSRADVAIVGGGYTGLAAARAIAQSGGTAVVLEGETIGWGASSRNGGFVLPGYKADLDVIVRRHGLPRAHALWQESLAAVAFVERLVAEEEIACDWARAGHVTLAARPGHLPGLASAQRLLAREFGYQTELLDAAAVRGEIGSARYHGGLLDPAAGALQPAAYLHGLADLAQRAGALLVERCPVTAVRRVAGGFEVVTGRGTIAAGQVLVATNGYTGRLVPWVARRVVPVGSFIIATAPLGLEVRRRLIPNGRMLSDTKNLLYYFRLSPDGRLVFGGRAAFRPEALAESAELLRRGMIEVYPELADTAVEFAWGGRVAMTLDYLPHAGRSPEGIAYAAGYGGHGVALASWLGDQVGRALGGGGEWPALAQIRPRAVPAYDGRPWFLPLAGAYYRLKDLIS